MSEKTIADKMFLRNAKSMLILNGNVHPGMVSQMPPELIKQRTGQGPFDVVLLFAMNRKELEQAFPTAKERLGDKGSLWVAYLKQTASKATDINRDSINAYAEGKRYHHRGDDLDRRRLVGHAHEAHRGLNQGRGAPAPRPRARAPAPTGDPRARAAPPRCAASPRAPPRRIAQPHRQVAQPALVADAADRAALHAAVEFLFFPSEQFHQAGLAQAIALVEIGQQSRAGRTCSMGRPAGNRRSRRCGCRSAAAGLPGCCPSARSSGRKCSAAHRAGRGRGWRRSGRPSMQALHWPQWAPVASSTGSGRSTRISPMKKVEPASRAEQQRVLAAPAQARLFRQRQFHHRRRIREHAVAVVAGRRGCARPAAAGGCAAPCGNRGRAHTPRPRRPADLLAQAFARAPVGVRSRGR
jgi:hypothetical protein